MVRSVASVAVLALCAGACVENVELASSSSLTIDAAPGSTCQPGSFECNNCLDDDGDGRIDGFDPHCTSPTDDREDSFATGSPGDENPSDVQDCAFDGNSGSGDDGCRIALCCIIDAGDPNCPPPNDSCTPSQECIDSCEPSTPLGCDCFGCCTICDGACFDILINPALAPDCDLDGLGDPSRCPPCQKSLSCGSACDPAACILCPGQTPDDLPPNCNAPVCPPGLAVCANDSDCAQMQFCSNGCCIETIQ